MWQTTNKTTLISALLLAGTMLFAAGCAKNNVIVKDTAKVYPATDSVEILYATPQRSYERIATVEAVGAVNSTLTGDRTALLKQLGNKAKAIGADAVIITDEKANVGSSTVTYVLTGTAIKYSVPAGGSATTTEAAPAATPLQAEPVKRTMPASQPAAAATETPAKAPPPTGSWLDAQPPQHFTIQLTASRGEQALNRYVEEHDLGGKVAHFKTRRNGEIWYALVYGSYPTRKEALAAIKRLPPSLRKASPFVRKFEDIRKTTVK
jgi:septal ring-binding cell division protein DamX